MKKTIPKPKGIYVNDSGKVFVCTAVFTGYSHYAEMSSVSKPGVFRVALDDFDGQYKEKEIEL